MLSIETHWKSNLRTSIHYFGCLYDKKGMGYALRLFLLGSLISFGPVTVFGASSLDSCLLRWRELGSPPNDILSESLGSTRARISEISRSDLERDIRILSDAIHGSELAKGEYEKKLYLLAQAYSRYVPTYRSVEEMMREGLIRIEGTELVSAYSFQATHLGVLPLRHVPGESGFRVPYTRGTSYFRGSGSPASVMRQGTGHSAERSLRTDEARAAYRSGKLDVIVAVEPGRMQEVLSGSGQNAGTPEILMNSRQYEQLGTVRVFRVDFPVDEVWRYERGLKKGVEHR